MTPDVSLMFGDAVVAHRRDTFHRPGRRLAPETPFPPPAMYFGAPAGTPLSPSKTLRAVFATVITSSLQQILVRSQNPELKGIGEDASGIIRR